MEPEFLIFWVVCIFIGMLIGISKRQETSAAIWTFLLGPVGIIIALCLPDKVKQAAAEEEKQRQLRLIQLQEEHLRELRALRHAPPASQEMAAPTGPVLEEFVPENLSPMRRR